MAVVDVITYNGELDMLKLRLGMLYKHVDQFIIVEASHTFTDNTKPLYFLQHKGYLNNWMRKITYYVVDENYSPEEIALAHDSPNTKGASHWLNEFLQKESIKKALTHLKDDDMVFIGDVDELWDVQINWGEFTGAPFKLKLKVYAYYLDNRSSEQFWGTLVSKYYYIKHECLNHLRTNAWKTNFDSGWHFTSMGGLNEVRRKLSASYTTESYNTYEVQKRLPERVRIGVDYLGRPFTFKLDESEWPAYLKQHRHQFAHLCKGTIIAPRRTVGTP